MSNGFFRNCVQFDVLVKWRGIMVVCSLRFTVVFIERAWLCFGVKDCFDLQLQQQFALQCCYNRSSKHEITQLNRFEPSKTLMHPLILYHYEYPHSITEILQ